MNEAILKVELVDSERNVQQTREWHFESVMHVLSFKEGYEKYRRFTLQGP
jgi:hypothetical protein